MERKFLDNPILQGVIGTLVAGGISYLTSLLLPQNLRFMDWTNIIITSILIGITWTYTTWWKEKFKKYKLTSEKSLQEIQEELKRVEKITETNSKMVMLHIMQQRFRMLNSIDKEKTEEYFKREEEFVFSHAHKVYKGLSIEEVKQILDAYYR